MIRAFVAVLLDDDLRARLGAAIARLQPLARGVSWVSVPNLHITLKFLGGVAESQLPAIDGSLATVVSMTRFDLTIRGLGAFPSLDRARVIWAGAGPGSAELARLAEWVDTALSTVGVAPETRAFNGHVTLGRVREPHRDDALVAALRKGGSELFGVLEVASIALMQSVLGPSGARYTRLSSHPLSAPPPGRPT